MEMWALPLHVVLSDKHPVIPGFRLVDKLQLLSKDSTHFNPSTHSARGIHSTLSLVGTQDLIQMEILTTHPTKTNQTKLIHSTLLSPLICSQINQPDLTQWTQPSLSTQPPVHLVPHQDSASSTHLATHSVQSPSKVITVRLLSMESILALKVCRMHLARLLGFPSLSLNPVSPFPNPNPASLSLNQGVLTKRREIENNYKPFIHLLFNDFLFI